MDDPADAARLEYLQNVLTDIRHLILVETESQSLLENVCRILVVAGKFHMVWIGMADLKTGDVSVVAKYGATGNYLDITGLRCDDSPLGQGPTGRAIRLGLHQINNDTEHVNDYAPWREAARKMRYRSSAAFPFWIEDAVAGTINIYANEPYAFGRKEVDLLDTIAELVGTALQKLEAT